MSNAARKARKRAGEKFVRTPKEPTPLSERQIRMVVKRTKLGPRELPSNRHAKRMAKEREIRERQD